MSHFSELKTTMKNRKILIEALRKLQYNVVEADLNGTVQVRGFFGATTHADFKIEAAHGYDIGFSKTKTGEYELVGDWDLLPQVANLEKMSFVGKLKRTYAREGILQLAHDQGYAVDIQNQGETIQMVVRQW